MSECNRQLVRKRTQYRLKAASTDLQRYRRDRKGYVAT